MSKTDDFSGWTVSSAWRNDGGSALILEGPDGVSAQFGAEEGDAEVGLAELVAIARSKRQPSDEDTIRGAMTEAQRHHGIAR